MQSDIQPALGGDSLPAPPQPPQREKLLAPVWHTVVIVLLILANSFLGSSKLNAVSGKSNRIVLYSGTFVFELFVVLLIWFWIRRRGISLRSLIGGKWGSVEDFLIDLAIAIAFLIIADLAVAGLRIALGTLDVSHPDKQLDQLRRTLGPLIPRNALEAGVFVCLSVFAGLFEEIIFRGYLQQQFIAFADNVYVGIFISAVIFGAAHGYQGRGMMVAIAFYGALFGLLAHFRKSLRPGMMAHAIQDASSGLALFFLK